MIALNLFQLNLFYLLFVLIYRDIVEGRHDSPLVVQPDGWAFPGYICASAARNPGSRGALPNSGLHPLCSQNSFIFSN